MNFSNGGSLLVPLLML